ncbi:MAG: chemotaxis protein CheB [Gemmatimonadota bacterium]
MTEKKGPANQPEIPPPPEAEVTGSQPEVEEKAFPVVGIGASAGGLAAFEAFFCALPADTDTGMAFVLVQHLAPDHKSILTELVKRYTRMEVLEVEDGMRVKPDCVYIIPPNRDMALLNGTLQLLDPIAPRGQRLAIDFFFRSLAQDQHERAICIVLSGTGSDGTLGVQAIKGEGGMAMAQNPESTEFDGMPRSAIATGLVDYVLPPDEMPAQLVAYVAQAMGKPPRLLTGSTAKTEDSLKKIFILLRAQTGHDFSQYKQNTIFRRVERRMAVHQIPLVERYARFLQHNPGEVEALFSDLLIGVTAFFRDREAFEILEKQVIPRLFAAKPAGAAIRVWVPGCSTGEEAYSIAMLLIEHMVELKQDLKLQVFATDIDGKAIARARVGMYAAGIAAHVSAERLARFFMLEPDGDFYRIHKRVRDILVFSEQDVIKDPPFSRLDFISCRNLMIYMGADLQKKLIPLFDYSLVPSGFLFLGTSETVGEFAGLFTTVDRKSKLYQRRDDRDSRAQRTPRFQPSIAGALGARRASGRAPRETNAQLRQLTERTMLQQYAPVGALVNDNGDILYLHGRTGRYLEPAPGEAGLNILKMARDGLRRPLSTALQQAVTRNEPIQSPGLHIKSNGDFVTVNLTVRPVDVAGAEADGPPLFLIILEETKPPAHVEPVVAPRVEEVTGGPLTDADARIAMLRRELAAKEENLQTTNEQLETSNEELKSSNEEMQSVNEELQSTNEELETSKEELQSLNEELSTVNSELQTRVADLSRANNDMNNLLAGTGVGTVFVDHQLHIKRFTPAVTQVINLILTDVGRPVGHIVSNLAGYDHLVEDVKEVLDTLVPKEVEVETKTGNWFLMRIRPYRTLENVIEGAVITFTDVTDMKTAQALIRESEALRRLAVVVRDSHDAISVHDLQGRILAWNPGAGKMYGWREEEALQMNIRDLIPFEHRDQGLALVRKHSRATDIRPERVQRVAKDGHIMEVSLTATELVNAAGEAYAVATTERRIIGGAKE